MSPNLSPIPEQQTTREEFKAALRAKLNAAQQAAAFAPPNAAIKVLAGAGTGKTELIAHRFVHLVDTFLQQEVEAPEDRILVVTFTEKAASSMAERIQRYLMAQGFQGLSPDSWISTFHGFCHRILKAHGDRLNLPPKRDLLDPVRQEQCFDQLIEEICQGHHGNLKEVLAAEGLSNLLPDSILSLDALAKMPMEDEMGILNALPALVHKIKALGLSPKDFLETAQGQSENYGNTLKTLPLSEGDLSNFPDWDRVLTVWTNHLRGWVARAFWRQRVVPAQNKDDGLKKLMNSLSPTGVLLTKATKKDPPGLKAKDAHKFVEAIERQTALELQVAQWAAAFYALYQQTLKAQGVLDYDDLIHQTVALLEGHPDLRQQYQRLFLATMVDEFQDSNGAQLRLMRLLMHPETGNILVVGDEKQSIYGFRYAQKENLDLIFEGYQPTVIPLQVNYRSVSPILDVANHLAADITDNDPHQQLLSGKGEGANGGLPCAFWIGFEPLGEDLTQPPLKMPELQSRETQWVAHEIQRLVATGKYTYQDCAILIHSHSRGDSIEQLFGSLNIPLVRQKNTGFFKSPVFKTVLAAFTLLQSPNHPVAWTRLLQSKLSQRQLRLLFQWIHSTALPFHKALRQWVALDQPREYDPQRQALRASVGDPTLVALHQLLEDLDYARQMAHLWSPPQLFEWLHQSIGFVQPHVPPHEALQQRIQLKAIHQMLQHIPSPFQADGPPGLFDTVQYLETLYQTPDLELNIDNTLWVGENAVQMITIHSAKGLEFPVVFVLGCKGKGGQDKSTLLFDPQFSGHPGFGLMVKTKGIKKSPKNDAYKILWQGVREEEEQKRLFYVALTRAEERLYVTYGPNSKDYVLPPTSDTPQIQILADAPLVFPEALASPRQPKMSSEEVSNTLPSSYTLQWVEQAENVPSAAYPMAETKTSQPLANVPLPQNADQKTGQTEEIEPLAPSPSTAQTAIAPLSFSSLKSFQRCPVQFWLRWIDKLPEPPNAPMTPQGDPFAHDALNKGQCLHQLLQHHFQMEGNVPPFLVEQLIGRWCTLIPEEKASEFRATIQTLWSQFLSSPWTYKALFNQGYTRFEAEKSLKFFLPLSPNQGVWIQGVIDLWTTNPTNGQSLIIDFKTNKTLSPEHLRDYETQLQLYGVGLRQSQPEVLSLHGTLLHIHHSGVTAHPVPLLDALPEVQDDQTPGWITPFLPMVETLEAVHRDGSGLPLRPPGVHCNEPPCPYRSICPQKQTETVSAQLTLF